MTERPLKYPLRAFLDLSTGHLSPSTRTWLDEMANFGETAKPRWVASTPYGWFVYADEEARETNFPADLVACMKKARELGAEYILFDRDAAVDLTLGLQIWEE